MSSVYKNSSSDDLFGTTSFGGGGWGRSSKAHESIKDHGRQPRNPTKRELCAVGGGVVAGVSQINHPVAKGGSAVAAGVLTYVCSGD